MSRNDGVSVILAAAQSAGCEVDRTRKGHWQVRTPSGAVVHHSGTASDWRAIRNFRAQLRRAGVPIP